MSSSFTSTITMLDFCGIPYLPLKKDKTPVLPGWREPNFTVTAEQMEGHQLGIITGKRANITVIDIDLEAPGVFGTDPDTFPKTYTVKTPSGGVQKYYTYDARVGQSQNNFSKYPKVDIRSEGGYVMAPPSEAEYDKTYQGKNHHIKGTYEVIEGDILDLSPFPYELFEEATEPPLEAPTMPYKPRSDRPGDDFEASVSWDDILTPHGFKKGYTDRKGVTHWTRPGKQGKATSATTMVCTDGRERMFVFSTNAPPFAPYEKTQHNSYNKLKAYSTLNHGGDFTATIRALREQGYGVKKEAFGDATSVEYPHTAPDDDTAPNMEMSCVADLVEEPIDWVWRGKIARGELCIIAGEPGASKTMVAIDLASRVTRGDKEPLGDRPMAQGSVVFLTSENHPTKVMRPRLVAAGADLNKVHILSSSLIEVVNGKKKNRHVAIAEDAQKIGEAIATLPDVVLLVIDPISEYMGKKDANNNADVRDMLATLTEHVRDKNVAVLAIAHFNKKAEITTATSRINGSIGFAGAARTAFAVGKFKDANWSDEEEDEHEGEIGFSSVKNNLSGDKGGFVYVVESYHYTSNGRMIETARIVWRREINESADDMLAKSTKKGRPSVEGDKCREWLVALLTAHKDGMKRTDVIDLAAQNGFSQVMVDRTSKTLLLDRSERGLWKLVGDLSDEKF